MKSLYKDIRDGELIDERYFFRLSSFLYYKVV